MTDYTMHDTDGTVSWADEVQAVANLAPAKVLDIIDRLSTKHNANIATRVWQELLDYDNDLVSIPSDNDDLFYRAIEILELMDRNIRVDDKLPMFLVGDYLNLWVHDNCAYDALSREFDLVQRLFATGKYDNVADASTDFFVAIHNTYYTSVVG